MKAKYDFRVMPNLQGKEEEPGLYPQLVTSGTITLKDMMERQYVLLVTNHCVNTV